MIPAKLPLVPFTEGDTWGGIPAITITTGPEGGPYEAPADELEVVTMRFRKIGGTEAEVVELSSADDGITINSPANWTFTIPPQIVPGLTAGKWAWRLRCSADSGTSLATYLADELVILETV